MTVRIFLLLFFLQCLALAANPATAADGVPLKKVSLLLQWKHQFEFAGFYAAKEKGYYQDAGLDVELLEFDGKRDALKEVVNGRVTFALTDMRLISQRLAGAPVVLLSNYFKQSPLAIVAKPEIRLPGDMKGKRFMVVPGAMDNTVFRSMFMQFGMSRADMTVVPHSFDVQDFIDGKVDAVQVYLTNEIFALEQSGVAYNVINPDKFGDTYAMNLFGAEAWSRDNPEVTRAFKQASDRGWIYALEHSGEIISLIEQKYNTQKRSPAALKFEATETARLMLPKVYPVGSVDPAVLARIGAMLVESGEAKSLARLDGFLFDAAGRTTPAAHATARSGSSGGDRSAPKPAAAVWPAYANHAGMLFIGCGLIVLVAGALVLFWQRRWSALKRELVQTRAQAQQSGQEIEVAYQALHSTLANLQLAQGQLDQARADAAKNPRVPRRKRHLPRAPRFKLRH
jgi:polar amino acid transport system substrate-binding protein